MTATLVFCQNVYLSGKFGMAVNGTWFSQNLSSFDLCSLNTTKQSTDVITSLSLIQKFTEHLDTSYNSFLGLFFQTCDFNFLIQMKNTSLNTASSNSTTTSDGEYILYRHDEVFICVTLRIRNPAIYCIHKLHDFISPWASRIFQSFQSRTLDDRSVISREVILVQQLTDLHVYQLKQLFVVYHIAFVHEYNDVRYTYLTGQKDVLFCLSHNTVCSSYYKDSSVHLCSTSDHVLYIVSMAWAVNVCIVSFLCLILNVCSRDCDTTLSLFRSFIDIFEVLSSVSFYSGRKYFCDSCGQSCFTMVNVADGTNVTMRFCSFKFSFSHFKMSSLKLRPVGFFETKLVAGTHLNRKPAKSDYIAFLSYLQGKSQKNNTFRLCSL